MIQGKERQGRRRKQQSDDLAETRRWWKLKEKTLDCLEISLRKRLWTCRKTEYMMMVM